LLCDSIEQFPELNLLAEELRELGVSTRLVLEKFDDRYTSREVNFFCNEIPFLTLSTNKFDSQWIIFKRALDIFGALIGLLLLVLFFPFLAIAIKLESPGPIFFIQRRVGENGRLFNLWKFRSMDTDAEERKKELLAQNEMNGAIFKIRRDPRVTRVGEFLRRTSLDEFPQFFNVLRGDMSLVGTRPPTPDEVANYENWQLRRISIKPGLTGLWQVSGRNKVKDFNDIVKIDLAYIDNWTPLLDIKILFKTVPVVISKDGSC
jgi:exopolysaccharide biosynthesis polyprenyl glycosylphosphotransferase